MGFIEYEIHSALSEDSHEGRVWIKPSSQNEKLRNEIEGGGAALFAYEEKTTKKCIVKRYPLIDSIWEFGRERKNTRSLETMVLSSSMHGIVAYLAFKRLERK